MAFQLSIFRLAVCLFAVFQCIDAIHPRHSKRSDTKWIPTWGSMPQLTEPANLPNPPFNQTGQVFFNSTIRQTIHTSLGGSKIRLRFSNAFGTLDLPITAVTVALSGNGSAGLNTIQPHTLKPVTFNGSPNFTVPDGALVVSDPIDMAVAPQSILSVTMYLATGQLTNFITSHPGSRTTSWMVEGDQVDAEELSGDSLQSVAHWYFLTTVEALVPTTSSAFIIVGDSITDGRASTTDANNRWPDDLLARMQSYPPTSHLSVINQAAGGNRILYDGLGPNAMSRIDRDVLSQASVSHVMIFEGVNDIGTAAVDPASQTNVGDRLIDAFQQFAERVKGFNPDIVTLAATITPFSGNVTIQPYSDPERENTRQRVNAFIRDSGTFDFVIDFDEVIRDPQNPAQLNPEYNSGDFLHPNVLGYMKLADSFDLGSLE